MTPPGEAGTAASHLSVATRLLARSLDGRSRGPADPPGEWFTEVSHEAHKPVRCSEPPSQRVTRHHLGRGWRSEMAQASRTIHTWLAAFCLLAVGTTS